MVRILHIDRNSLRHSGQDKLEKNVGQHKRNSWQAQAQSTTNLV